MKKEDVKNMMSRLAQRRPVFHSEADFQHELALELVGQDYKVRLEKPFSYSLKNTTVGAELDILATNKDGRTTAIELKYVKTKILITHEKETFDLADSWGTNLSRFDCLADFQRVAGLVNAGHADCGVTIFLTNVSDAWGIDTIRRNTMAKNFSIHDGRDLTAGQQLNWNPLNPPSKSVRENRLHPYAPIVIPVDSQCSWTDYSNLKNSKPPDRNLFRYLLLGVARVTANGSNQAI